MRKLSIGAAVAAALALLLCVVFKDAIIAGSGYGVVIYVMIYRILIGIAVSAAGYTAADVIIKRRRKTKRLQAEAKAGLAAMEMPEEVLDAGKVTEKLRQYSRFPELREPIGQAENQIRRIEHRRAELEAVSKVIKDKTQQAQASNMTDSFLRIESNLLKTLLLVSGWMELYAAAAGGDTGNGERAIAAIRSILIPNDKDIDTCKQILVKLTEKAGTADAKELMFAAREAESDLNSLDSSILNTLDLS